MRFTWRAALAALMLAAGAAAQATPAPAPAGVVVTETADAFTLSNGVLAVHIAKASGNLSAMRYQGVETLFESTGRALVYWSHDMRNAARVEARITIDPQANGGERAEVSVKGVSDGRLMGFGPGAPPEGNLAVDIDIRYSLARGDTGVYTYTAFEHRPEYPAGSMVEARIAARLAPWFDTIHVDPQRSGRYPLFNEGIDKYVYVARQAEHRAYGWTSSTRRMGWFIVVPSAEFLSGGPTKAEFLAHGTTPIALSYWRSSHNGGASVTMAQGETWRRVVGPMLLYVNEGATPEAMWADARARLQREQAQWPYDWVNAPGYANRAQRAEVAGRVVLDDPLDPLGAGRLRGTLHVGLTQAFYEADFGGTRRLITWQQEGKHPQFWARSDDRSGRFVIPHVPAGRYTLSAFADGVLGELMQADIAVRPGARIDLGDIAWRPQRHGRQLWEIGTPDRGAAEFAGADRFFVPGQALRYAARFPQDIDFTIGRSNPATDWWYSHMPHGENPDAEILPFRGVAGTGRDAPRHIRFRIERPPQGGQAVLRIAINGAGARPVLDLAVNGRPVQRIDFGRDDGSMTRHQVNGVWRLVDTRFDATLLRAGDNVLTLTVPAGPLTAGVIYDYLRLELEDDR